jgi:predicted lipoprotein with Yx(FWY)xxD motif
LGTTTRALFPNQTIAILSSQNRGIMRNSRITLAIVGLSFVAAAGGTYVAADAGGSIAAGPSGSKLALPAATTALPDNLVTATLTTHTSKVATVHTASATVGGMSETILVNGKGLPLYFYQPDTPTRSMVSGQLAALWPPLDSAAPTAHGVPGSLKVVNTTNGRQVAYRGHFLYTFVADSPGQVTGQGVQHFFVATPRLSTPPAAPPSTKVAAPTRNGY